MRARPHPSLWATTAPPAPSTEPLQGEVSAEVAIVGGGVLGSSTALHLARQGVRVALLEAHEAGWGASGRNNGQVIPTITRPDPEDIVRAAGETVGPRLVRLIGGAAGDTFDLIRRHAIDCEGVQNGWVQPAHRPSRMAIARRRVQQWQAHGFDVRLLDRDEVNARLGTDAYHGGWTAPTGGQVNPLALTRGLARAAIAAGAQLHFDSPVTGLQRTAGGWSLQTAQGRVSARKVFLATAAYTDGLWPGLARSVVPIVNWQLSTRPLPPDIRARVMPANMTMSDTHGDLRFARLDAFGRLVSGAALILPWNAEARLRPLIAQRLQALFPALRDLPPQEFDHVWSGLIAMTPDFLPHFHELDPGVFAALGCNGRGLSMSIALGRAMADALRGVPTADLEVPLTTPKPLVAHAIARRVAAGMLAVYRWRDGRD